MSKNTKSERTRGEILDAAWTLIAERGASVSLGEVAAAAGITRQSVYVHFGSRGGLLLALVRRADERAGIWKKFDAAFATPDPRERFRACLAAWFDFVPYIYPVASDLIRLRATDEEAAAAWDDRMDDLRRAFRQLIRGLDKAGELASHWSVAKAADFLWAGSSVESWGLLTRDCSWSEGHAAKTITAALERALLR
ncbi:TetR/AcrR family transcriptional regulator [Parvibaculum sp.]|jgi:AcrR family transcriptional regulator|uniref:TetR/AcrR family transcriptional regulator n=1 Tax=Parvibaculum sp. TaxID=2024848 RepID=UPI001B13FD55|nr:TetR/AcrR family transcriptional regulator [Parvibaculum sp.]MBO6679010.1 TetR/AcrR family transcriptional regulator [Parvibaculum sp.]MBO6686467.1 TetR/AcrR family transcriptional regulator [Parvibaculum sp.]MBO6905385.1 TetR/AcrR family transcriptional regulator [Parvibaculum sp.]